MGLELLFADCVFWRFSRERRNILNFSAKRVKLVNACCFHICHSDELDCVSSSD